MHKARQSGKHVILNPAPAVPLPKSCYQDIDTLILNETESNILAGSTETVVDPTAESLTLLAKKFLSWGVRDCVVITLGEKGLVYATSSGAGGHVPAFKAKVKDTTAAGDTFAGAYAVQRVRDLTPAFDYTHSLRFATLAASKTVEKSGAMASIPRLEELELNALA